MNVATPAARQRWISLLARADRGELESAWAALDPQPRYHVVRGPEIGLVMVRGRAGGTGARFNLGEMTVTRCTVQIAAGALGHAYVAGRRQREAELAAVFDGLLQDPTLTERLAAMVIAPLAERQEARRRDALAKAAATRVEFFTMVRGDE